MMVFGDLALGARVGGCEVSFHDVDRNYLLEFAAGKLPARERCTQCKAFAMFPKVLNV